MKKYLLMFISAIIFLSAFTANKTAAQTRKVVRANVPFEFRVGDKTYPAGKYLLEPVTQLNDNLFQLRSFDQDKRKLLVTTSVFSNRQQTPKLVFYRIGEEYYLTNIFVEDGNWGFSLRPSKQVKNGKKLASTKMVEVSMTN